MNIAVLVQYKSLYIIIKSKASPHINVRLGPPDTRFARRPPEPRSGPGTRKHGHWHCPPGSVQAAAPTRGCRSPACTA
eukprot:758388-Hanusia_phi.AAC.5